MNDGPGESPLVVDVLRTPDELTAVEGTWEELLSVTPLASGFQSAAWLLQCWLHLRRPTDSLFVCVVTRDEQAVALFPTQLDKGGRLSFIGEQASNYSGPVYRPDELSDVLTTWIGHLSRARAVRTVDLSGLRDGSPVLDAMRARSLPRLGEPSVVQTHSCPEAELDKGWEHLYHRHRRKHRSSWKRQERRLAALGDYRFLETGDPGEVRSAMPRMAELFRARWEGQRVSGGLTTELEGFHTRAAVEAAKAGHVSLGLLILDGQIIAFSYGVRSGDVTTSYFVAHDENFGIYSVGLLLLLRVLEGAARKGDPVYDFSLGSADYKGMWATRERAVFRLLWGRGRRWRAAWAEAWVRARSIPVLQKAKQHGVRSVLGRPPPQQPKPDAPGLPAGEIGFWNLYRISSGKAGGNALRRATYGDMRQILSPKLLTLAVERSFRGDELHLVEGLEGLAGVVWLALGTRRQLVLEGLSEPREGEAVYYHPIAVEKLALPAFLMELPAERSFVVASPESLPRDAGIEHLGGYQANAAFKRPTAEVQHR